MDFEFDLNLEGIEQEISEFNFINGVPYQKANRKLKENQGFFVTHLEIREKTGIFAGKREATNLLDTICRDKKGFLRRDKVEKRVKHTNDNHNKNWFIVEVGMILNLRD